MLRAEFATPGGLERCGRDLTDFPFPDLDDEVENAWLELPIRFRTTANFRGPIVERAGPDGRLVGQEVADIALRDIAAMLGRLEPPARVEMNRVEVGNGRQVIVPASVPAHSRRCRSSMVDFNRRHFCRTNFGVVRRSHSGRRSRRGLRVVPSRSIRSRFDREPHSRALRTCSAGAPSSSASR